MDRTRIKARTGLVALPLLALLGVATACGDDGQASDVPATGNGPGEAAPDDQVDQTDDAILERYDSLASLDWCEEIGTDAVSAIVGPIDGTESDRASTFGDPGCRFSGVSDAYLISLPLAADLSGYRESSTNLTEAPVDLDEPGLGAVYEILPTERGEVNTLELYIQAEPFVVIKVKVNAYSLDEGVGARDRDVALQQAIDLAGLALAVVAAN